MQKGTFGAGCFWYVEKEFRKVKGVKNAVAGYSGGRVKNPSYENVCTDKTGHAEVVQVEYDPKEVSYDRLLDFFWSIHNPTHVNRQGLDFGSQYRSVIFYHNQEQKNKAIRSKERLSKSGKYNKKIATEIMPAKEFYKAEEYHQHYLEKKEKTILGKVMKKLGI